MRKTLHLVITGLFLLGSAVGPARADTIGELGDKSPNNDSTSFEKPGRWIFRPAINAGYNKLLSGYEGYEDLGNIGLDLYLRRVSSESFTSWVNHLIFRLSLDYFPLQVPSGLNGITEDLYSANFSILYEIPSIGRKQFWFPIFLGAGYARYQDKITIDNSTSGKVSDKNNYNGFVFSWGANLPAYKYFPFKTVPEMRYHRYKRLEDKASHMTYQLGVILWPREKDQ